MLPATNVLEKLKAHPVLRYLTLDSVVTFTRLASHLKRDILQPQISPAFHTSGSLVPFTPLPFSIPTSIAPQHTVLFTLPKAHFLNKYTS